MNNDSLKRIHFSEKPFRLLADRSYKQKVGLKPQGLWYSVEGGEDGWKAWCTSEDFCLENLTVENHLTLDESRLLKIKTVEQLDHFHERFMKVNLLHGMNGVEGINWKEVAKHHSGIEIAPYRWSRRMEPGFIWYYSWDCASGCIWDLSTITALETPQKIK